MTQPPARRILMLGATGTIGRATLAELLRRGHAVTCLTRPGSTAELPPGATARPCPLSDAETISRDGFRGEPYDAVVSCMASRTGSPADARAIDQAAHSAVLAAAQASGVGQFILLSAICVQKPLLAFQRAKLAFEAELMASTLNWSIVRPTAFFKSLSGQIARVQGGKPFLVFGDGRMTACKPISDRDLAAYLADCMDNPDRACRILPIGGPGPAITPLDQVAMLAQLMGRPVPVRRVPVAMMSAIIGVLGALGRVSPTLRDKAELARIGRYYATESMLVWDAAARRYDADGTPEFGADTLARHYAGILRGEVADDRGDHAVF
jgi:divinyl chlorophyllide a 8-vinyl-reductase